MKNERCPVRGTPLRWNPVSWQCMSCPFSCAEPDLPRIAAAMELARELVKLEKCERIGPEYHRLEKSIAQMEYRVIKVFGGE